MSTDSTPSTTNLRGKRLYEYTDEELLALLESRERQIKEVPKRYDADEITSPPWWSYALTNGVIYLNLTGGNDDLSLPSDLRLPLKDYEWFTVEVWDYHDVSEELKQASAPSEIKYQFPGFPEFNIKIEWQVWPHTAIDPRDDIRFKDQPWAKDFKQAPMGYSSRVTPATFGEIVRFCDKISGLKAFW